MEKDACATIFTKLESCPDTIARTVGEYELYIVLEAAHIETHHAMCVPSSYIQHIRQEWLACMQTERPPSTGRPDARFNS